MSLSIEYVPIDSIRPYERNAKKHPPEQNGRTAFCMEYDPRFVDVIIDRWEKFTGRKAVRIDG